MEDIQPNELRLSRKGSERVPTVRSSHPGTYWRGYPGRGHTPRTSDYNPSRLSRPWRTPTPSRQHLAAQPPPRCPSRERYSYGRDVPGSSDQAGIATHFEQLPKRAKVRSVDAPPVDCQQDFSSLGKLWRNPRGIPGGSRQAHDSTKQTELPERDCESSVNGFECAYPDPNTSLSSANHSKIRGRTEDYSLRLAIHVPARGIDRNHHFNEEQARSAEYLPPRIQPKHGPPEAPKLVETRNPSEWGLSYVTEPEVAATVNLSPPSRNLISGVEAEQFHEGRSCQIPYRDGLQLTPSPGPTPSWPINPDEIIDLTQDLSESPVEKARRWTDFRSGVLDLPLLSPAQTLSNHSVSNRLDTQWDTVKVDLTEDHGGYCHYGQPIVVEPDRPVTPNAHENPLPTSFNLLAENLRVPLELHDRFRRIVNTGDFSHIVVTMHGFINRIREINSSRRCQVLWSPSVPTQEHVDDACLLPSGRGTVAIVLAHAREDAQLTFLTLKDNQVFGENILYRDWDKMKKGGVSALTTMMQPLKFASGGYDHKIHLWSMEDDLSHASFVQLAVRHTSMIHGLLPIRDTSHKLVSAGADRNVHLWDLCSERVAHTLKTSNIPHNLHQTESPFCTLLEVAHLDLQFEVHDHRIVPRCPVQRFGFPTQVPPGRYMKGDTWSHFFASGDRGGQVRIWDLRNVSGEPYLCQCFENEVIQVVKTGSHILACSRRSECRWISIHND